MATMRTETLRITIDAPAARVTAEPADPLNHAEWATEFFVGPAVPLGDGEFSVTVPRMGGAVRMRVDSNVEEGVIDMFLAPEGAPYGPPLPVRVLPNMDGADVLFTLARFPGQERYRLGRGSGIDES